MSTSVVKCVTTRWRPQAGIDTDSQRQRLGPGAGTGTGETTGSGPQKGNTVLYTIFSKAVAFVGSRDRQVKIALSNEANDRT